MKGPSATWFASTAAIILVAEVVLAYDGVYWPLALSPIAGYMVYRAFRAAQSRNI